MKLIKLLKKNILFTLISVALDFAFLILLTIAHYFTFMKISTHLEAVNTIMAEKTAELASTETIGLTSTTQ
jgi:hypothetical protein